MDSELAAATALEEPKSTQSVFDLPCGFIDAAGELHTEVAVRELSGAEEDLLAQKQITPFKKFNELLSRCTLRLGTITERGRISAAVNSLTVGDRLFLLFAIRRISLGDGYTFDMECPNAECKAKKSYTIQLSSLEVRKMPEPKKRIYDVSLPSGATARYRVSTGADEERTSKLDTKTESAALSKGILMRLELLNGVPPELPAVVAMSLKDRLSLRSKWDKVEGGVDTEAEMQCPVCSFEFKKDVEVTPNFFFPSETSET